MNPHADSFHLQRREEFRLLADTIAAGSLVLEEVDDRFTDDEADQVWRQSRRQLINAIRWWGADEQLVNLKGAVSTEWYTPAEYVDAAREVMGGIDLDPASSALANETVRATRFYDKTDNGLERDWAGRVWLNPPYGKGTGLFVTKLTYEYEHGYGPVSAAILLINAYGFDTVWFQPLWSGLLCFTDHRISFTSPQRGTGGPANANLFVYLGGDCHRFREVFGQFGHIVAWAP